MLRNLLLPFNESALLGSNDQMLRIILAEARPGQYLTLPKVDQLAFKEALQTGKTLPFTLGGSQVKIVPFDKLSCKKLQTTGIQVLAA